MTAWSPQLLDAFMPGSIPKAQRRLVGVTAITNKTGAAANATCKDPGLHTA
jgi:hypothetical protein